MAYMVGGTAPLCPLGEAAEASSHVGGVRRATGDLSTLHVYLWRAHHVCGIGKW